MMKKTVFVKGDWRLFYLQKGFVFIGKEIEPRGHYQIGCEMGKLPTMYMNFQSKPWIRDLYVMNVLLVIPYLVYLLYQAFVALMIGMVAVLAYALFMGYWECLRERDKRLLLIPIAFWQLVAMIFGAWIIFR